MHLMSRLGDDRPLLKPSRSGVSVIQRPRFVSVLNSLTSERKTTKCFRSTGNALLRKACHAVGDRGIVKKLGTGLMIAAEKSKVCEIGNRPRWRNVDRAPGVR
jgi:hypothetical protein